MVQNKGLSLLMDRLFNAEDDESSVPKDALLVKIIRNISLWTFNLQQVNCSMMQQTRKLKSSSHWIIRNDSTLFGGSGRHILRLLFVLLLTASIIMVV